jgi:hypothetical protein
METGNQAPCSRAGPVFASDAIINSDYVVAPITTTGPSTYSGAVNRPRSYSADFDSSRAARRLFLGFRFSYLRWRENYASSHPEMRETCGNVSWPKPGGEHEPNGENCSHQARDFRRYFHCYPVGPSVSGTRPWMIIGQCGECHDASGRKLPGQFRPLIRRIRFDRRPACQNSRASWWCGTSCWCRDFPSYLGR